MKDKLKVVEINTVDIGSTGRIMLQIAQYAQEDDMQVWSFSVAHRTHSKPPKGHQYYLSFPEYCVHYVLGKLTGGNGLFSVGATLRLLHSIRKIDPDIIHLHNLHGFSINLPILFRYLKRSNAHVVWTLHDCWSFTGHCSHFTIAKCDKWKTGCYDCPIYRDYPQSNVDNSKWMWKLKKKWFTGIENMTIVTPSQWLADLVKQSYLKDYPAKVINNGIDLSVFKPTRSNFRAKHHIPSDKPILLGVAFGWGVRKGLDVFIKLAEDLGDTYQIVLVGTDEQTDAQLPKNIISIHRTQNQQELAEVYSAADVVVNPTREENFPTVNMEALACGTPVITFDTGGSPEIIDETCGIVVPCDDIPALVKAIRHVVEDKPFTAEACRKRAEKFDMQDKFAEYVQLYHDLYEKK